MNKSGVFIVDKPKGMTSNDVVQILKRKFNFKKIGHAGTLDPLATGVVVVLVNNGTKMSDYFLNANKKYEVTIKLFCETDTYDSDGKITNQQEHFTISKSEIEQVVAKYNGLEYEQTPPIYSAIKVGGKKLYEYARNNQEVEIKKRKVSINNLVLKSFDGQNIFLTVDCSKGTYIRSLAVDIAKDLKTIGHVTSLRRIKSGNFDITDSIKLDKVEIKDLLSLKKVLEINNYKIINYENIDDVLFGKKIILNIKEDIVFIQDNQNNIIACYQREKDNLFNCKRGGLNN